jgi:hypothetical protein
MPRATNNGGPREESVGDAGPYSIGSKIWPGTSKVIEECGELLEVAGKLMGSGGDTAHWTGDLRSRLLDELADASAAIHFFASVNLTAEEWAVFERRNGVKGNTFFRWHVENGGGTRRFDANADRPDALQIARADGYTEELQRTGRIA